jgi:hypothetical protein
MINQQIYFFYLNGNSKAGGRSKEAGDLVKRK